MLIWIATFLISSGTYAGQTEGAPECFICTILPHQTKTKVFDFLEFLKGRETELYFKSDEEADAYFYMYRKGCAANSPSYQAYLSEYKTYIQTAEDVYGVPFSALACLMFKESQFDNSVRLGIAQFTPDGVDAVNESLVYLNWSPGKVEGLENIIKSGYIGVLTQMYRDSYPKDSPEETQRKVFNASAMDQANAAGKLLNLKNSLERYQFAQRWKKYLTILGAKKIPTTFNKKDPMQSVAAAAILLNEKMDFIREGTGIDKDNVPTDKKILFWASMSGAYNIGMGAFRSIVGRALRHSKDPVADIRDPLKWIQAIKTYQGTLFGPAKVSEVSKQMDSIVHCMTKGDTKGPLIGRGKGVSDKQCKD